MGRWRWFELTLILLGALILRSMLIPLPPNLSHDSWRYLWDARVTLHGYSPYVYAPGDPRFLALRDFIYDNSRFRGVPTIYPPGAQAIYLLSYLIAPSNLFFLKSIFVACDIATCIILAVLLYRKRLDPARVVLYAWCPLPIVEFAMQGHLDALTLFFTMLTLIVSMSNRRGMRVLTGFLLAMATLTKIYPLLLLVVVVRRRDWAMFATCFGTIIIAYTPYLILGHGQVFGFFSTYASERTPNAGIVPQVVVWLGTLVGIHAPAITIINYLIDLLIVGAVSLSILRLRWNEQITMESAALVLFGTIFAVSSHIFPWYTPTLLPWLAFLLGAVWTRHKGLNSSALVAATLLYFTCMTILGYFFTNDWRIYYLAVYDVTVIGLVIAALPYLKNLNRARLSIFRIWP